jgi:RNA polymerase sigma-70 factor, ECF subfamily
MEEDLALLGRMALGDEAAMRTFYDRHKAMVGRLVRANGLSEADAAELVQETFFRAWKSASSFRGQSTAATWLRGIVRHLLADHIDAAVRARAVFVSPRAGADDEEPVHEPPSPEPGPEKLAEMAGAKRCIDKCMARLGAIHREVLALRICGPQMKEQEVASLLGVPLGTVKSRTSIALRSLSACVEDCYGSPAHG